MVTYWACGQAARQRCIVVRQLVNEEMALSFVGDLGVHTAGTPTVFRMISSFVGLLRMLATDLS